VELTARGRAALGALDVNDKWSDEEFVLYALGQGKRSVGMVKLRQRLEKFGYDGEDVRDVVMGLSIRDLVKYA